MENKIEIAPNLQIAVAEIDKIKNQVLISSVSSFESVIVRSSAIVSLRSIITDEIMQAHIMPLMGSRLGFKTDKDKNGGYPVSVVKDCLIEAVLSGVNSVGNQFNIIAGNMYITKEGFTYLLKGLVGLSYSITYPKIQIAANKVTADAECYVRWSLNGIDYEETLKFTIKAGAYASEDAIMGKAERKTKHWLYNTLTGSELPEGEIDLGYADEVKTLNRGQIQQLKRKIEASSKLEDLQSTYDAVSSSDNADLQEAYNKREAQIVNLGISKCTKLSQLEKLESMLPSMELYQAQFDAKKTELIHL